MEAGVIHAAVMYLMATAGAIIGIYFSERFGPRRYTRDEIISAYLKACLSTTDESERRSQKRYAAFLEALDGK